MNKKKKIALISSLTLIPSVAIIAATVATCLSNSKIDSTANQNSDSSGLIDNKFDVNSNNNTSSGWIYNDVYYSDFNDIVKNYVKENNPISSDYYIGDFTSAFNYKDKTLKMEFLRPYDENRILPAYKMMSGNITSDFDKAKKSFKDGAFTDIWYTDFNGKVYKNKEDAKDAIKATKVSTPILYYTLPDGTRINPLNKIDINNLKTKTYEEIYKYLSKEDAKLNSNISISLYEQATDENKNKLLSSKYSNAFLNKGNVVQNLVKDLLKTIFNLQRDFIFQNVKFDVKLQVHNTFKKGSTYVQGLENIKNNNDTKGYANKYKYGIADFVFDDKNEGGYKKPKLYITNWIDNLKNSKYFLPYDNDTRPASINSRNIIWNMFINDPIGFREGRGNVTTVLPRPSPGVSWRYSDALYIGNDKNIHNVDFSKEDYLIFPSVPLDELSEFDVFLSEKSFNNPTGKFSVSDKVSRGQGTFEDCDLARNFHVKDFRGCSFSIPFFYNDDDLNRIWGNANGVDFELFKFGTHSKKETWDLAATFDITLKKSEDTTVSEKDMFNYIEEKINEKFMLSNNEKFNNYLVNKVLAIILNLFKNNPNLFWNEINKILNDSNWSMKYTNNSSNLKLNTLENNPRQLFSLNFDFSKLYSENLFWFDKKTTNKFLNFNSESITNTNKIFDGIGIEYDKWLEEKVDNKSIKDILNEKKLKLIIEYNNNPLFMINTDLTLIDNNKYSTLSYKSFIKKYFFSNETPTSKDLDNMINVSQNFDSTSFSKSSDLRPDGTVNYFNTVSLLGSRISELSNGQWKFNYKDNDIFSESLYPKLNDVYQPDDDSLDKFKIDLVAKVFNEIKSNKLANISNLSKPEDVVFLFNRFDGNRISGLNLKFRRFLGQSMGDNPSLSNGEKIELYDNLSDLEWAMSNKLSIDPGMIVILKDIDGNILNPGFEMTNEELSWITSDAVYGTEAIIRDNYIRSKIIRPLEDKVYYKENGNTETLISNEIDKVFTFTVPDKNSSTGATITYYYLSYEDCFNNLVSYLHTLCTPITIKK